MLGQSCPERAARLVTLEPPCPPAKLSEFWQVSNVFIFGGEFKEGVRCERWVCLGQGKCYWNGDVKGVSRNIIINKTLESNANL